ncbi:DNA-directed RNA polymerase subunit P [archaeon]|nr:DNA-directed RNA polymerase subunit P [archaeon]
MEYVCFKCNKTVDLEKHSRVRCPFCGGKILYKQKPETVINVDAK